MDNQRVLHYAPLMIQQPIKNCIDTCGHNRNQGGHIFKKLNSLRFPGHFKIFP